MRTRAYWASFLGSAVWFVWAAGCRTPEPFGLQRRASLADEIVSRWTPASRLTAELLIDQYGPPDAFAAGALAWKQKGPWKRIVVLNADEDYVYKVGSTDNLRETVAYHVAPSMRVALAAFSEKVSVSPDGTELSALSNDERLNFLALNLADEIHRGVMSPVEAQRQYVKTVELSAAGKSSPVMRRLLFGNPP